MVHPVSTSKVLGVWLDKLVVPDSIHIAGLLVTNAITCCCHAFTFSALVISCTEWSRIFVLGFSHKHASFMTHTSSMMHTFILNEGNAPVTMLAPGNVISEVMV